MIYKLDKFEKFDAPVDYSRVGYNNGEVAKYPGNYDLLEENNGVITFKAVPDPDTDNLFNSSRLVTKNSLVITPPFSVECEAMWSLSSMGFYCPFWLFPLDPYVVSEIDGIEWNGGRPDSVHFTYHNTGSKCKVKAVGDEPYTYDFKSRNTIRPFVGGWNKYKVKVGKRTIKWYMNDKKVKCVFSFGIKMKYYVRSTLQVATWASNPSLQEITQDNPAIMKVRNFIVEI